MHIDGACHCGKIRYEAEVDPEAVSICHCTDCQTSTGSVFRTNVPIPGKDFKMLSGTPTIYVKTTADSGNPRAQAFCPECGTQLYATSADDQKVFGIRVGTCNQRAQLVPQRQVWCRSALPWVHIDTPQKAQQQA